MDREQNEPNWALKDIRDALLDGNDARDVGGEDARANRPAPDGTYLPRFMRDVVTRGEAMGHVTQEWARDQFGDLASALRNNPFAVDAATEKARHVPITVKSEIDRQIAQATTRILDLRAQSEEAGTVYRRDLQAADATHPRRGWIDATEFWLVIWTILCVEGGLCALMLWHALGPTRAVFTGLVLSAASLAGGYFAAKALLRPVNHSDVTPAGRVLQWLLAAVVGLATLFFLYVGACYRAAWIDGADGTPADIVAKFYSPLHVLVNFDVLALAALGIVGFFVGAFECWRCFNGYRALLRESGIAKAHADSAVREAAEELKASAHRVGIAGEEVLADIEDKSATWMRSVADHCDAANGVAYEVHRRDDLVGSCVESIYAENAEGYQEVRHFERAAPFAFAVADADLEVPDLFVKARQSAIAGASEVSKAVRQAREQIAAHVKAAIVQIDELAGLRPVATDRVLLPKGDNS